MKIQEFTLIIGMGGYYHINGSFSTREAAVDRGKALAISRNAERATRPGRNRGAKTKAFIVELKEVIE